MTTTEIRDYPSRVTDPGSRKLGTFSYLPAFTDDEIQAQVAQILDRGWTPALEHVEPARATNGYWYLWKLPLFGATDVAAVLAELEACRAANPGHHIRLIGYDRLRQTQGMALVVHRGQ